MRRGPGVRARVPDSRWGGRPFFFTPALVDRTSGNMAQGARWARWTRWTCSEVARARNCTVEVVLRFCTHSCQCRISPLFTPPLSLLPLCGPSAVVYSPGSFECKHHLILRTISSRLPSTSLRLHPSLRLPSHSPLLHCFLPFPPFRSIHRLLTNPGFDRAAVCSVRDSILPHQAFCCLAILLLLSVLNSTSTNLQLLPTARR